MSYSPPRRKVRFSSGVHPFEIASKYITSPLICGIYFDNYPRFLDLLTEKSDSMTNYVDLSKMDIMLGEEGGFIIYSSGCHFPIGAFNLGSLIVFRLMNLKKRYSTSYFYIILETIDSFGDIGYMYLISHLPLTGTKFQLQGVSANSSLFSLSENNWYCFLTTENYGIVYDLDNDKEVMRLDMAFLAPSGNTIRVQVVNASMYEKVQIDYVAFVYC